jgi:cation transport ATPase
MDGAGAGWDHPAALSIQKKAQTMDKRTIIVTQIFMTCLMALSMSGIMSLIALGPSAEWFATWMKQFIIAWPIAFVMTNILWPIASAGARVVLRPRGA